MPKKKKLKLRKYISSLENPRSLSDLKSTSHNGSKENIGSEEQTGETTPVKDEISEFKYKSQSQAFPLNNINKNQDEDDVIKEAHNTIQISEKKKIENELKEEIQKVDKVKEEEKKKQKENTETQQEINENKVEVKVTITQTTTILNASEQEVIKRDDLIKETITGKDVIQLKKKPQIIYSPNIKDKKRHSIELQLIDSDENRKNNKKASILKNKLSFQNKSSFFDTKNNTAANSNMNSTEEPKSKGICTDCLIN